MENTVTISFETYNKLFLFACNYESLITYLMDGAYLSYGDNLALDTGSLSGIVKALEPKTYAAKVAELKAKEDTD